MNDEKLREGFERLAKNQLSLKRDGDGYDILFTQTCWEFYKAAYSAGAEQMRERAAREAQYYSLPSPTARSIMRAIKSLPIGESSQAPQEKP